MQNTEKTRLRAVFSKENADRPPVICPGGMMSAATSEVLAAAGGSFHTDATIMAEMAEAIRLNTGFENLGVPFCMTVEAEAFGSIVELGDAGVEPCVIQYGADSLSQIIKGRKPGLQEGRLPVIIEAIQLLASRNAPVPIIGNITGPVSLATSIMDPLQFFRCIRKNPEEVTEALSYVTEYLAAFARKQIEAGADAIAIADPTATGEILGNENFRRFAIPALQRLSKTIQASGAGAIVHICGDATVLLDSLCQLEGVVLSFDSLVNLANAKKVLANHALMGNVNTQLLHTGEPGRIRNLTENLLAQKVEIIAPACGISLATPRENLRALTDTVKGFNCCDGA